MRERSGEDRLLVEWGYRNNAGITECCVTASPGFRRCVPFPVINPGPVFLVLSSLLSASTRLLEENALCGAYRDDNVGSWRKGTTAVSRKWNALQVRHTLNRKTLKDKSKTAESEGSTQVTASAVKRK